MWSVVDRNVVMRRMTVLPGMGHPVLRRTEVEKDAIDRSS